MMFWFIKQHRSSRVLHVLSGVLIILTCLATLGSGEHYVIDLILSWPLAAGMWALVERDWRTSAKYFGLILVWEIALRTEWALQLRPWMAWAVSAMTIAVSVWYYRKTRLRVTVAHVESAPVPGFDGAPVLAECEMALSK
jgi:hypothetical protein